MAGFDPRQARAEDGRWAKRQRRGHRRLQSVNPRRRRDEPRREDPFEFALGHLSQRAAEADARRRWR